MQFLRKSLAHALRIKAGDVVAFVGGGGKTSAMFRLANQLAAQKLRVLTTTTTRIFAAQAKLSPAHLIFDVNQQPLADILPQLTAALAAYGQVLLIGPTESATGKAFGIPPETVDEIAASGLFDVIINEADGARMRPFKAPADHEPVIPACTTLVVPVCGLDGLYRPLNDDSVHRAERISRLSQTPLHAPVTAETVASVLGHAEGGLKNVPPGARVVPLLNKVASSGHLAPAQTIAQMLLAVNRIHAVVIGEVQAAEPVMETWQRIALVILAAGGSTRFGSPKQLARWDGQTFIERVVAVALASQARPVVVVLGAEVAQSRALLAHQPVQIVVNPDWTQGQSTSIKAGLNALPANIGGVIFLLADQPGISPEVIDALITRHRQTLAPVVWPEFNGQRGNPVLFDRTLFGELQQISGDTGGKPVLLAYQDQAQRVMVDNEAVLLDFDRPGDLGGRR